MRLLIFLLLPVLSFAQKNISGIVKDGISGKEIPYATIGLIRENKGVTSNEQGSFTISASFPKTDTLRISSVGYETLLLPVAEWINRQVVTLHLKINLLKEVVVSTARQKKIYTINEFGHCSWNWYKIGLGVMSQLAQRFEAPKQGMQLTELELCKDNSESIFRIRIYNVDSIDQSPSKDLVDTVIEVKSQQGHVRINLEDYNIIIPGKSYFVAIEWSFIPFNTQVEKQKIEGKKRYLTYYKPFLRFVRDKNQKQGKIWELSFNGKWTLESGSTDYNFQITSRLR